MAQQESASARTRTRVTFYAARERLLARNEDGKVIDLGRLSRHADGSWHYLLDGNRLAGGGSPTPETAMADAARRMGFLYLDGQFTAVGAADAGGLELGDVPAIEVVVDELQAGERMQDGRV